MASFVVSKITCKIVCNSYTMFGYCAVVETHEEATNLRRHLEESIHLRMCVIDGLEA